MAAIGHEETANLIFDADDTLWGVEELYDRQREEFVALMERQGLGPGPIVEQLAREIDKQRYAIRGVSPQRFPESLVATYRGRCKQLNQPEDARIADQVKKIGEGVFDLRASVYPDVQATLDKLQSLRCKLYLWTRGDPRVQRKRLAESGLECFFPSDCVAITQDKSPAALQNQVRTWNVDPAETWMIGNSLESDIKPAAAIGLHAIWIPRRVWNEDVVLPEFPKDLIYLLGQFGELVEIFAEPSPPSHGQEEVVYLFVSAYHSLYRQYVLDILSNPRDDVIRFPYDVVWVPGRYKTTRDGLDAFAKQLEGKSALIVFTDERVKGEPRRSPHFLPIRGAMVEKAELHGELIQIEFSLADYVAYADPHEEKHRREVKREWVAAYDAFVKTFDSRPRLNLQNCAYIARGPSYSNHIATVPADGEEEEAWQKIVQVLGDLRGYPTFNPRPLNPNFPEIPNPFQYAMFYRISGLEDLKTGQRMRLQATPRAQAAPPGGAPPHFALFAGLRSKGREAGNVDYVLENDRDYRLHLLFSVPQRPESQVQHSKVALKFAPDKALVPLDPTEIPLNFSYDYRSVDFFVPRTFEELRGSIALTVVPPAPTSADDPKQPMTPAPVLQIRIKANRLLLGAAAAVFFVGGAVSTLHEPLSKIIANTVPMLNQSADAISVGLGVAGSALSTAIVVYLYRSIK